MTQRQTRPFWWNQNSYTVRMAILDFYRNYTIDDMPEKQAEQIEEMYENMQDSFHTEADFEAFRCATDSAIRAIDFKLLYPYRTIVKKDKPDDATQ